MDIVKSWFRSSSARAAQGEPQTARRPEPADAASRTPLAQPVADPGDTGEPCPLAALDNAMRPIRASGGAGVVPTVEEIRDRKALWYAPENHLLGTLIKAHQASVQWKKPVLVDTHQGYILLDASRNLAQVDLDAARWEGFMSTPVTRRPMVHVFSDTERYRAEACMSERRAAGRLDQLLWRAGLETSAGRIPLGTDLTKTVHLKHWPNLTRLTPLPEALRMSALWTMRGAGLLETAQVLGVRPQDVFTFFSAVSALSLVSDRSARTSPKAARPELSVFGRWVAALG